MRIAYVLMDPGIGLFGTKGASIHAQEMIRAFRALGHDVTVYCIKRGTAAGDPSTESVPADLRDLPVYVVPTAGGKGTAAREQALLRCSQRAADLVRAGDYDLVYERYCLFSNAGAEAVTDPPDLPAPDRGTAQQRPPLVVEVNAPLLAEQSTHRSLHDAAGALSTTRHTFRSAALISCVSSPVADWARSLLDAPAHPPRPGVVVIPNGVDVTRFRPALHDPHSLTSEAGKPASARFTVGFLGTLKPWHGTELLLRAFATAASAEGAEGRDPWQLQIIGDGPEREALQRTADELGIGAQTVFHGSLPPAQVPTVLRGWDVACAPYPLPDGAGHYFSPLKVYEYMAAGLPTLTTAVGDLPNLISDHVTGRVVPASDVNALSQALAELAADGDARHRMGSAARAEAEAQHSWISRATEVLSAAGVTRHTSAQDTAEVMVP